MSNRPLPVASKNVETGEIKIYPSICAAGRAGFKQASINRCLSGGAQTHGGCRWVRTGCELTAPRLFDGQEKAYADKLLALSQRGVRELINYDPETGIFTRPGRPDEPVGRLHKDGYRWLKIGEKEWSAHRLAWLYMTGEEASGDIDHINGIKDDNRFENLRVCESRSMNMGNQRLSRRNTSGAKGVSRESGRYRARLHIKGKVYSSALLDSLDEAAHAYNKLALEHFGDFAVLNPIGTDKAIASSAAQEAK